MKTRNYETRQNFVNGRVKYKLLKIKLKYIIIKKTKIVYIISIKYSPRNPKYYQVNIETEL